MIDSRQLAGRSTKWLRERLLSSRAERSATVNRDRQDGELSGAALAREVINTHSKSFALASRLFEKQTRERAVVVYAWCRRADDAVDSLTDPAEATAAVASLREELDRIFSGQPIGDPILDGFAQVARATSMPIYYPQELLAGMAMDADDTDYPDWETLYQYCFRVAGTVGLMMSHVIGLFRPEALLNAVHLGIAMQLTNICRDVREDWDRGRLYLPDDLLAEVGLSGLRSELGRPLRVEHKVGLARAIERVLVVADRFYRSGDRGMSALPWRGRCAVAAARAVYSEIGVAVRHNGCDVFAPRAVVGGAQKATLAAMATASVAREELRAALATGETRSASADGLPLITFPDDVELETTGRG